MKFSAIIFDMDGLMLDTESIARCAWQRAALDWGYTIENELYAKAIGRRIQDTRDILLMAFGKSFPFDEIRKRKQKYIDEYIAEHVGAHGEALRLREDFNMDLVGWASSFLLVPEATCVDDSTRELLRQAGEGDLYMSDASPLGITFNNLRNTGSELLTRKRAQENKPGSPCPKGFLATNTEFAERPICLASRQYQKRKLDEINNLEISDREKEKLRAQVVEKSCICDHLANGALINLGLVKEQDAPQSICPGPNTAWFTKIYTLQEMVDHIYGRGPSLTPPERPHMFAKEIEMYVDYFEKLAARCALTPPELKAVRQFKDNLEEGMDFCLTIAKRRPYQGENLASISSFVKRHKMRLQSISADFEKSVRIWGNQ